MSSSLSNLVGKRIGDQGIEAFLRENFSRDGGMLIDGEAGKILRTNCMFAWKETGRHLFLDQHGTRHSAALHLAACRQCVAIVRSQDGYVTLFSSEHLQSPGTTLECFRVLVGQERDPFEILMDRTPLARFMTDKAGAKALCVPECAKESLQALPGPIRVSAFVTTAESSLSLNGADIVFTSLFATAAVKEGIDATAIKHPDGGLLLVLDCEGFDKSQLVGLAQLNACQEGLASNARFDRRNVRGIDVPDCCKSSSAGDAIHPDDVVGSWSCQMKKKKKKKKKKK